MKHTDLMLTVLGFTFGIIALICVTFMNVFPKVYYSADRLDEVYSLGKHIGGTCDSVSTDTDVAVCARYCYYNYVSPREATMCALGVYDTALRKRTEHYDKEDYTIKETAPIED